MSKAMAIVIMYLMNKCRLSILFQATPVYILDITITREDFI